MPALMRTDLLVCYSCSFILIVRKLTAGGCGGFGVGLEPGIVTFQRKIGKSL